METWFVWLCFPRTRSACPQRAVTRPRRKAYTGTCACACTCTCAWALVRTMASFFVTL